MSKSKASREQIAQEIHTVYFPNDKDCYYTDKDWLIAKRIGQLQAELTTAKEALRKIKILNADKDCDIKWLCTQALKHEL